MNIKETAIEKSYNVTCVHDEADRDFYADAFIDGAEWMQETMIEKATKWLQDQIFGQEILLYEEDIASFRKAMKE